MGGNPSLLYPTTKGAIIQMTRAMAAHHGQENIRVNCVCPGMVYTPMTRGRGMTDEMRQARVNQNLMKIEGTGWDVGYGESTDLAMRFQKTDIVRYSYLVSRQQGGSLDYGRNPAGGWRCKFTIPETLQ
jgi:NAD(P)-dependent dehydrogenase (short-subunit alcohol dehydrogenase family)